MRIKFDRLRRLLFAASESRAAGLVASRYLGFGLQFFRGLVVAKTLGPALFGAWGFLILIQRYATYANLGAHYAVTVELSLRNSRTTPPEVLSGAVIVTFLSGILVLSLLGASAWHGMAQRYLLPTVWGLIAVSALFVNLQQVMMNAVRVIGDLRVIAWGELARNAVLLIVALFCSSPILIAVLLWAMLLTSAGLALLYAWNLPAMKIARSQAKEVRQVVAVGVPLLLYNVSFFLIGYSAHTVVGLSYSADDMGRYSLAASLSNAVLLGLNSVAWVFMPSVLRAGDATVPNAKAVRAVRRTTRAMGVSSFILILLAVLFVPALVKILPEFDGVQGIIPPLLIAFGVLATSMGVNSLLVARDRRALAAFAGFLGVVFVTSSAIVLSRVGLDVRWIAVAVAVGALVVVGVQAIAAARVLHVEWRALGFDWLLSWQSILSAILVCLGAFVEDLTWSLHLVALVVFTVGLRRHARTISRYLTLLAR